MNISRNSIFLHISSIASCLLLLFVMSVVFSNLVYAGGTGIGLYKDCYFADDFGGRKTDRLVIRPIGKICFERCEIECNNMLTVANVTDPSLNIDVVQQCKKNCRAGDGATKYNLKFKASDGSIVTKNDISIGSACGTGTIRVDSSSHNVTLSSFVVKKQEQLYVKLFPTANDGYGRLSMCGSASKTLIPVSDSLDNSNWIANYPWSTSPSAWAVKNPYVVDTGIDVKNGDLLSITLETVNGSYFAFQDPQHETSKILVRNPFAQGKSWLPKNGDSMKSTFSVLAEKNLVAIKQNSDGTYEDGTTGNSISDISTTMLANSEVSWNGLFGKADTVSTTDAAGEIVSTKRVFRYAGQLEGFSDNFTRLGLMHFENISNYNSNAWNDNLGGFTVNVSRQGCIYKNGERLQYAVLKETGKLPDSTPVYISEFDPSVIWKDLNDVVLRDYEPLTIDEDGMVAFRIKPLSYNDDKALAPECTSNDSICLDSKARVQTLYGPANSDGKYLIQVEKVKNDAIESNVVSDIIRKVKQYLFGSGTKSTGVVQQLFNKFVEDSRFVKMIQATILLFMTWTGLSYVIGLAQITQRDGIIRLITLGIVLALLQPNSWVFFNTYLFALFIDGGGVLIANFINYEDYDAVGSAKNIADVGADPSLVFSLFDKAFNILLSQPFWYKVGALIFSGWLGVFIFFAIFIATVLFSLALIKAFIIYMVSMVMMGILLLLAPIFITFLLFKYTRKMFTSWLGQLISVTLQPVIVIVSLGIFTNLFLAGIYSALGFSACKICLIGFAFPVLVPFFCIVPGLTTLNMMHSPDDALLVSPITNVGAAFYIFIIGHAMYVFVDHSVKLVNTIINQNFFTGINLSGYSNISSYTTGALGVLSTPINFVLGRSDGIVAARGKLDAATSFIANKYDFGKALESDKQVYPKVSDALKEVAKRTGTTLTDKDFAAFMSNSGAKGAKSDGDYNKATKSMSDKIAALEKSTLTKDEIIQALLRSPTVDRPLTAGDPTAFRSIVDGKGSSRFDALVEQARENQKVSSKEVYPKVYEALKETKALSGEGLTDKEFEKFLYKYDAIGATEKNKSDYISRTDHVTDKIAILENSTFTPKEIAQVLIRTAAASDPILAGSTSALKAVLEDKKSDRIDALIQEARENQNPKPAKKEDE